MRPPAATWFLCTMGGTGDTVSATSAIATACGSPNHVAVTAAIAGMMTFIASAVRASSAGCRNR